MGVCPAALHGSAPFATGTGSLVPSSDRFVELRTPRVPARPPLVEYPPCLGVPGFLSFSQMVGFLCALLLFLGASLSRFP